MTVSPSILAALNGNYRNFWATIERVRVCVRVCLVCVGRVCMQSLI